MNKNYNIELRVKMELRVLKYFLAVAQEENLTRAAETLLTSQSNLSRQLADLENELGKKLFIRGSRKITLTEEGLYLHKRAREIIELTERTENELMVFDQMMSGTVHIGAAESQVMRNLAKVMMELRVTYPLISFDIFSGSTIEVTEQLDKGIIDFAVLVAPIDFTKYDYIKLPSEEVLGLIMREDSSLAEKKVITSQDIGDSPVIVSKQQLSSNILSSWLGADMKTLNIVATFNLITSPAMMVEAGMGVAFTFDKLVMTDVTNQLTFRPLSPAVTTNIYLVWKKTQVFTRAANLFLEQMKQYLSDGNSD